MRSHHRKQRCESREIKRGESSDEATPKGLPRSPATHANAVRIVKNFHKPTESSGNMLFFESLSGREACLRSGQGEANVLKH